LKYPKIFEPTSFENFEVNGKIIQVPKVHVEFKEWTGTLLENRFGGKSIISHHDKPMFAELAIMNIFIEDGWNSRWIETYGKPKMNPIHLSEWLDEPFKNQIHKPIENKLIQVLLNAIAKMNGNNFGGCWDVIAWKSDNFVFAESKRSKKDCIQTTQNKWINSAFEIGITEENFIMIEWSLKSNEPITD
jgi:hypothetical protein